MNTDAYGKFILDSYEGKRPTQVIERDDGHIEKSTYSPVYFSEFKDWPLIQQKSIQYAKGEVLDIGTGAGRVSLYLQQNGHKVVAVDNSPLAVEVCKKRGVLDARVLPIEEISSLHEKSFDTVVLFGLGLGLLGSKEKSKEILKSLYEITNKDALIIGDGRDPYKTEDPDHLNYHKYNKEHGRMAGQVRIRIEVEDYKSDWINYLLTSKVELEELLQDTGWKVIHYIDPIHPNDPTFAVIIAKE